MKVNLRQRLTRCSILALCSVLVVIGLLPDLRPRVGRAAPNETQLSPRSQVAPKSPTQDARVADLLRSISDFDLAIGEHLGGRGVSSGSPLLGLEQLARAREVLYRELISLDPEAAVAHAMAEETYRRLPLAVKPHFERRFSANGDFWVREAIRIDRLTNLRSDGGIEREIVLGAERYRAFVYGRRENMPTKMNIPLSGVIFGDIAAVDESPAREISPSEYPAKNVDQRRLAPNGIVAEVGGELEYFADRFNLENYLREQHAWEAAIGPVSPHANARPKSVTSAWTEGVKRVLIMRVDFPDHPGEPVDPFKGTFTEAFALSVFNNQISPFYVNNSFGKTSLQPTVTSVVRMPQNQSFYFNNFGALNTDARNAARAAGFEPNNFELDTVVMSYNDGFTYAGLGSVGGKGAAINGFFDMEVFAHEFGHNYGLLHANRWRTTDGSVIGAGMNQEYGNGFDMMGVAEGAKSHFNAQYKRRLGWLTNVNVQTVTTDGTYRIYAEDASTPGGLRALRIPKDSTRNYWIEFRQLHTDFPAAMNGAFIMWDYQSRAFWETQLLDLNPATQFIDDAPLPIGQSFLDTANHIRFTVLGKGNTVPESLDVKVELFVGCSYSLVQTSQNFAAAGGGGSIAVTTQPGCRVPAVSNNDWLVTTPVDAGGVNYVVAPNFGTQPRTGTITVGGQTFTVQQGAVTTACVTPPSGLVAWWRAEGNARDQTGQNNGTLFNNMSFTGGRVGGGFLGNYQDDKGVVEVPDSASLALYQSMTFEGWIRVDATGGAVIDRRTSGFPPTISYSVAVADNGTLEFQIYQGAVVTKVASDPLPLGQLVHFAATLNDATSQFSMYINGALVRQTVSMQRPNVISNAQLWVGNINGVTDELSVYNRALSAAEIQTIYQAGIAGTGAAGKCVANSGTTPFDFDGDHRSDISVFRRSNGVWYLNQSTSGFTGVSFGLSGDLLAPADFDGDGKTDLGVFRNGTWYLLGSSSGFSAVSFGAAGDLPVPADYDGDGRADVAVFRPAQGTWYLLQSTAGFAGIAFGQAGDRPVPADYDGDGKTDIAVFREGIWYLLRSTQGFTGIQFGAVGDRPVVGDYDGDGKADEAVYRNGVWYLLGSQAGFSGFQFGLATDTPTPGDYDGDGRTDAAVFRDGVWYLLQSTGGFAASQFGAATDRPVPAAFVP